MFFCANRLQNKLPANSNLREVHLVPPEGVFPLFYSVFALSPAIAGLAHSFGLQPVVCYDEPDPGEKLSWTPLHLSHDLAGPVPGLRLIREIDKWLR
jgi:hypothetical protein